MKGQLGVSGGENVGCSRVEIRAEDCASCILRRDGGDGVDAVDAVKVGGSEWK